MGGDDAGRLREHQSVANAVVEQIADVLELRATDPQQRAMREAYLSEVAFPPNARVLDIGCGWEARLLKAVEPLIGRGEGIDFKAPALKLPGIGRLGLPS